MTATIRRGKMTRADLALWDGKTATASRVDATGGTVTGLAVGNEVDVLQVFGSGTDRTRATIVSALNNINTTVCTLVFAPGTWAISSSLTIPSNFTCHVPAGCVFSVDSGATLTFAGKVDVEYPSSWTTGLGSVVVSDQSLHGAVSHRTTAEIAAGVTPTNYAYPPGDIRRYGGVDGADSSAALQAAHDGLPDVGGRIIIKDGTYLVKDVEFTKSDFFIQCDGLLKHASTTAGYLVKIGSDSVTPARISGYLRFDSSTNESAFASIVSAVRIAALVESDLTLDCDGFVYGVDVPTEGPVAYNKFHLLNMLNCRRAVYIHPGAAGYCNRNDWYGGRFALASGISFNSQWSIYIEDSGANTPNDNQFWSPSFEGKAGAFYNEGFSNHVHGCRLEITTSGTAGTDFADPYINQRGSGYSKFSASYTQQMLSMSKGIGAGTRVSDYSFTLAGTDYTEYAFPGAKIYVTVSGTEYECTVYSSSFSTDTTVRVVEGFITGNPTAVKVQLVKKASGAECEFFWPNDDVVGVSDAQFASMARLLQILARSSVTISSFDANRPALRLRPGSSSTDTVLDVADLSGVLGLTITGNGYLNAKRFGLSVTPAATQSAITAPTGGATQDAEARTAINSLITAMEVFGLVTPN